MTILSTQIVLDILIYCGYILNINVNTIYFYIDISILIVLTFLICCINELQSQQLKKISNNHTDSIISQSCTTYSRPYNYKHFTHQQLLSTIQLQTLHPSTTSYLFIHKKRFLPFSNISTHNKKIQFSPRSKNFSTYKRAPISEKFFCSTPLFFLFGLSQDFNYGYFRIM